MIVWMQKLFESKGYEWSGLSRPFELNIFSVRSSNNQSNSFDDDLILTYRDSNLDWIIRQYSVTTDPGLYYLNNPLNVDGTAILCPGQYKYTHSLDLHRGKYLALCQRLGPVKVYRDSNKDSILDFNPTATQEGNFGINIHKASDDTSLVNKWSAGCTVFQYSEDFSEFIQVLSKHRDLYENKFTYTLFLEDELS